MRETRRKDLGAIAVLGSIVLFMVGAFMALALNVGLIMNTRGQLQNASDSAALAAAGSIDATSIGRDTARQMALNYAAGHRVLEGAVTINEQGSDVTFGRWNFETRKFVATTDELMINAVKVVDGADGLGGHNKPLQTFFAGLLGRSETSVPSAAVAIGRGARTDCPMPFVLPSCLFMAGGAPLCGAHVTLKPSTGNSDNVGFIYLPVDVCKDQGNAAIECMMRNRCRSPIMNAETYDLQNGADLNNKVAEAMIGVLSTKNGAHHTTIIESVDSTLCPFGPNSTKNSFPVTQMTCPPGFQEKNVEIAQFVRVQIDWLKDNNGTCYSVCPQVGAVLADPTTNTCPVGAPTGMGVTLICDGNNGFSYNTNVALRLVE